MESKPKPCKGIGQAKNVKGCGKISRYRKWGLCSECLGNFLFENDLGKLILQKRILKQAGFKLKKERKEKDEKIREKLKTLSQYEAEAKKVFQKWVRLRDKDQPCISCGTITADIWDGGHFAKAEIYSGLIFDERNVNRQCRKCNRFLGGNELEYRKGLISRYGQEFTDQLEEDKNRLRNYKYTKDELVEIKKKYQALIKQLEK